MGKIVRVFIIIAVFFGVLFLGKNTILKFVVEKGVQKATGLPMKIKKFDLGFAKSQIGIWDLELFNPDGFSDKVMFHAPEIFVDYHLGDILRGNIHLEDIRMDFDQFTIVKNAQGQTNIEALKQPAKKDEKPKGSPVQSKGEDKASKAPDVQIDHISLKVGKVVYKNYSQGGNPVVKEFNVNISEEFSDIKNVQGLMAAIVNKTLAKTALNSLADLNIDAFEGNSSVPQEAVEKLKGAVGVITDKIKLPFGQ